MSATLDIITQALEDGQGRDITALSVKEQSGQLIDWMVIVTAKSSRHATALAEKVQLALKASDNPKHHIETSAEKSWILVDANDTIIHIMQQTARDHYRLEDLWGFEKSNERAQ